MPTRAKRERKKLGPGDANYRPPRAFTKDTPTRVNPADTNDDPEAQAYRAERRKRNRADREYQEEVANLAFARLAELIEADSDVVARAAADSVLNRVDGMPTQRNEHTGADGKPIATENVYRWASPETE